DYYCMIWHNNPFVLF
nr:immunoglobulin light chain junction region [Macaca mulatta]MOV95237.1 immunoglobulin light chain junction region [Macaca mulatta]MOV98348.1 immunoglobulin light chain junction region [Macaca mulatta]